MRASVASLLLLLHFFLSGRLVDAQPGRLVDAQSDDDDFEPELHKNWKLLAPKNKCGLSVQTRIIGGHEVAMGTFPWIARIAFYRGNTDRLHLDKEWKLNMNEKMVVYGCGGTLISKYFVLTAAHCTGSPSSILYVRLGEHNTLTDPDCEEGWDGRVCAPPVQDIRIVKVITHEQYSNDQHMTYDVALLKLESPPQLSPYVQPVCLPYGDGMGMDFENEDTTVAGWGRTEEGTSSHILLAVTQQVSNPQQCRKDYSDNGILIDYRLGQMCVGGHVGKDSCNGDSGGPLMWTGSLDPNISARVYLIGLVSLGPESCGVYEIPGVYSRISYFMRWILDHLED